MAEQIALWEQNAEGISCGGERCNELVLCVRQRELRARPEHIGADRLDVFFSGTEHGCSDLRICHNETSASVIG